MDRLYNVTIEYLGSKKQDKFPQSAICLGKDGAFLVMDKDGQRGLFVANDCKVAQIAAHVIIIRGYTDKPSHMTAYCIYANAQNERKDMSCWNKEQLEQMLEDVVNELDLSDQAMANHGPLGTPPAELVRIVLAQKDATIRNLRAGLVDLSKPN